MAKIQVVRAASNNLLLRVFIQDSSKTTGAGLTGLTNASTGLNISVMRELDATATVYTVAASHVQTITTLGTYAAPTAANIRFKEVDATNLPGVYELQFEQASTGTADASRFLTGMITGVTNMAPCPFEIQLSAVDPQTATPTAAAIATGVWQDTTGGDFTTAGSIGKSLFTSGNAPGAASGIALVGSNVGTATSVSGAVGSVTGAVGSVTGAVGSVTGAVGSVAGNVGGNVVGSVASVVAGVTVTTNNDKTGYALTVAYDPAKTAAQEPVGIKKNTALPAFSFPMMNPADHVTPLTGLAVSGQRRIDAGVFAACANPVTEIGATGVYTIDFAASDLNGGVIIFEFTAVGGDPQVFTIVTCP